MGNNHQYKLEALCGQQLLDKLGFQPQRSHLICFLWLTSQGKIVRLPVQCYVSHKRQLWPARWLQFCRKNMFIHREFVHWPATGLHSQLLPMECHVCKNFRLLLTCLKWHRKHVIKVNEPRIQLRRSVYCWNFSVCIIGDFLVGIGIQYNLPELLTWWLEIWRSFFVLFLFFAMQRI